MAPHRSDTLLLILTGGTIVYAVIGVFIIRRWALGRAPRRPISAYADPEGWIRAWLPLLIAVEAFALGGGAFVFLMILVALPADQTLYPLIGAGGGLILVALCLAGFDVALVARVRTLGRRPAGPTH